MREFGTGATRNDDKTKNDYRGFRSPLAMKRFGDYMTEHRVQSDGTIRDSDNWKKGMPRKAYLSSLIRHVEDVHLIMEGHVALNPDTKEPVALDEALAAIMFNSQGLLHEVMLGRDAGSVVDPLLKWQHNSTPEGWHDVPSSGCIWNPEEAATRFADGNTNYRQVPA